jgi:uncharacterized protein
LARKIAKKENSPIKYVFYIAAFLSVAFTILSLYLYSINYLSLNDANTYSSIALSMMFSTVVIAYLFLKGNTVKEVIQKLGLSRDKLTTKAIIIGLVLFFAILVLEVATGLISQATGVPWPTNVAAVLGGEPLYFLVFAFLIAPINEEIFFRGFLVPRIGIIFSALIFAVLHAGYMSISEFAAAFVFGILAGYVFKKNRSLYSTILAHFLVNFLTIIVFILLGAAGVS